MWGYVIDKVYGPNLPASLAELRARITEAVATINADTVQVIWDEIAFRWAICRVKRGSHAEHL